MRSFIIITVLSALAACYGAAVLPTFEELTQNLEPYTIVDYADDYVPSGRFNDDEEFEVFFERNIQLAAVQGTQRFEASFHGEPDMKIRRLRRIMNFKPVNSSVYFYNNVCRVTFTIAAGDFFLGKVIARGERIVPEEV